MVGTMMEVEKEAPGEFPRSSTKTLPPVTFFDELTLPFPKNINPHFVSSLECNDAPDDDTYHLIRNMDLAMAPATGDDSGIVDFAVVLLRALGYERRGRILRTRKSLPFVICGENRRANADVCLIDENHDVLLVVQGMAADKDPEPPLIAEAIAAFSLSNRNRTGMLGLPPLASELVAGIPLTGTLPVFYKMNVTAELVTAVGGGVYPETPTIVYAHFPAPHRRSIEGMKPLENRNIFLLCYEAFKRFVN